MRRSLAHPVRVRLAYVPDARTSWRWPQGSATCPVVAYEGNRRRTDEPCPVVDRAGPGRHRNPVLRAECRLCGYAGQFDTRAPTGTAPVTAGPTTWSSGWPRRWPAGGQGLAAEHGACLRLVQLRRTEIDTGHIEQVLIPCGHRWPRCAGRAPSGPDPAAATMRRGLAPGPEPVIDPDPATEDERAAVSAGQRRKTTGTPGRRRPRHERPGRADRRARRADHRGRAPRPGTPRTATPPPLHQTPPQDAVPLPSRTVRPRTVGKTYTTPDGKTFRPSLFVTRPPVVPAGREDGAPADPDTYDYTRAARDALHFAALFDRFIQNLRRFTGYDLQYFAAIELQRRLAPHIHLAIRGTISRQELREVLAATYHQVWWPSTQTVKYDGGCLPTWDEHTGTYLDPDTGEVLPTWDQALDAIGDSDEPLHVARFGARLTPRASSPDPATPAGASATSPNT